MKTFVALALVMAAPLTWCAKDGMPTGPVDPGQGLEATFVGTWKAARPDREGVIVNVPRASCGAPIVIAALETDVISYKSSKAETATRFELMEFNSRVTWMPETGTTSIAEAKSADQFWLYSVSPMGKADWDTPVEYTRCPVTE